MIRVCAPDAVTACRATLCFDAVELGKYFQTWEKLRKDNAGQMPNPALTLGRSGGAELNVMELVPVLDAETEKALRWQVEMWHEVGSVQQKVRLDATEYGILRGVILPAIQKRIVEYSETSIVGRWWRRLTPAVVRRALSRSTNVMVFLLDHPWVQWIALWLAKVFRMLWCLSLFGVGEKELEAVKRRLADIVRIDYQHPWLSSLFDLVTLAFHCVAGNIGQCLWRVRLLFWRASAHENQSVNGTSQESCELRVRYVSPDWWLGAGCGTLLHQHRGLAGRLVAQPSGWESHFMEERGLDAV